MLYPSWWLTRFIENLACNEFQAGLYRANDGSLGDPSADERNGGVLGGEHPFVDATKRRPAFNLRKFEPGAQGVDRTAEEA